MRIVEVVGMLFGDEGKGSVVSALCYHVSGKKLIVRASGGPQAAHHIVATSAAVGTHHRGAIHRASQLGSGVFHGADVFIGGETVIHLGDLAAEVDAVCTYLDVEQLPFTLYIDPRTPVICDAHIQENRKYAAEHAHGSCGRGTGPCFYYAYRHHTPAVVTVGGVAAGETTQEGFAAQFLRIRRRVAVELRLPEFRSYALVVSECGQGTLLDRDFGFAPYASWTSQRAFAALCARYSLPIDARVGVVRAYATRHGAGPFPCELPAAPGPWTDNNNPASDTTLQGAVRYGYHDLTLLRYSQTCHRVDSLVVNHMDCVDQTLRVCDPPASHPAVHAFNMSAAAVLRNSVGDRAGWARQKALAHTAEQLTAVAREPHLCGCPDMRNTLAVALAIPRARVGYGDGPADADKHLPDRLLRQLEAQHP